MAATEIFGNIWIGIVFALFFSLGIGALNGYLLVKTKLHSFLVTLSSASSCCRVSTSPSPSSSRAMWATEDISGMPGFNLAQSIFASSFKIGNVNVSIAIFYWIIFALIATWGSAAHPRRQLDLRGRRPG